MIAYHNDPAIKDAVIAQLVGHRDADEIIKGRYWEEGKGCAVGCTIYSGNHKDYETRFGIPQVLAQLEDRIFEGLPNGRAREWPIQFMSAIKPGSDLGMVWPRFALWLLTDELSQQAVKWPRCVAAVADVATLYREWVETGKLPDQSRWKAAARSADYAADYAYVADAADAYAAAAAAAAARSAADADAYAYAADAYAADAYAAAYAAAVAVARSAAYAAYAADARSADYAASRQCYVRMADKLIEIIAGV